MFHHLNHSIHIISKIKKKNPVSYLLIIIENILIIDENWLMILDIPKESYKGFLNEYYSYRVEEDNNK